MSELLCAEAQNSAADAMLIRKQAVAAAKVLAQVGRLVQQQLGGWKCLLSNPLNHIMYIIHYTIPYTYLLKLLLVCLSCFLSGG